MNSSVREHRSSSGPHEDQMAGVNAPLLDPSSGMTHRPLNDIAARPGEPCTDLFSKVPATGAFLTAKTEATL